MVRDAAVPLARVRAEIRSDADRPAAQRRRRVDRLARRHAREAPARAGAEVARPCATTATSAPSTCRAGQQAGVHGHRLEVAAERLPGGHRRRQPARLAQPGTVRENQAGRAPPSVIT